MVKFAAFFDLNFFLWFFFSMASSPPTVLILGHSFVRRLSADLRSNFDARAAEHFNLLGDAVIHLHGLGGCTVKKLRLFDLGVVSALKPDVIILEIGTNDLVADHHEVVGSEINDLVQLTLQLYSVQVIGVCEVIPRVRAPFFNVAAPIFNQYLTDEEIHAQLEMQCMFQNWSLCQMVPVKTKPTSNTT